MGCLFGKPKKGDPNATLELLPCEKNAPKVAVRGVVTEQDDQQDGFAPKKATTEGVPGILKRAAVGYVCRKGLKPESPSQDDFCIFHTKFATLVGVFDGHGPYGHHLANYVQEILPREFLQSQHFKQNDVEKALKDAFAATQKRCLESQEERGFDCSLSGTTATMAFVRKNVVYIANVGDSTGILARKAVAGKVFTWEQLTRVHRLSDDEEKQRVEESGGEVKRLDGDLPQRLFLKNQLYPGLINSRSLGDTIGTSCGVISDADVRRIEFREKELFMLICSDGVWEFFEMQEAVDLVAPFGKAKAQEAAEALAKEAWKRWIQEEGNVVDDITVIVCWL
ncbi:unnamed protein product [Durusdinium trenchii]|uniref:PPM-type phosphatase domain-containing protein n=2 Tax=Durusdinium trenchii TaxID=1381693 RepID=A0ABP0SPH4_9DINO